MSNEVENPSDLPRDPEGDQNGTATLRPKEAEVVKFIWDTIDKSIPGDFAFQQYFYPRGWVILLEVIYQRERKGLTSHKINFGNHAIGDDFWLPSSLRSLYPKVASALDEFISTRLVASSVHRIPELIQWCRSFLDSPDDFREFLFNVVRKLRRAERDWLERSYSMSAAAMERDFTYEAEYQAVVESIPPLGDALDERRQPEEQELYANHSEVVELMSELLFAGDNETSNEDVLLYYPPDIPQQFVSPPSSSRTFYFPVVDKETELDREIYAFLHDLKPFQEAYCSDAGRMENHAMLSEILEERQQSGPKNFGRVLAVGQYFTSDERKDMFKRDKAHGRAKYAAACVERIVSALPSDGRAVVHVNARILYERSLKDLRTHLVSQGYLESVIYLPALSKENRWAGSGSAPEILSKGEEGPVYLKGTACVLLVLNGAPRGKGVQFVDLSECWGWDPMGTEEFPTLDLQQARKHIATETTEISTEDIAAHGFDLSLGLHRTWELGTAPSEHRWVILRDLLKLYDPQSEPNSSQELTDFPDDQLVAHYSSNPRAVFLSNWGDLSAPAKRPFQKGRSRLHARNCLVMKHPDPKGLFGLWFEYEEGKPLLTATSRFAIYLFEPKEDAVDPAWLAHSLSSPIVTEQLQRFRNLGGATGLDPAAILNLKIAVPSLERQKGQVETARSNVDSQIRSRAGVSALLRKKEEGFRREMRFKRHALAQVLGDIQGRAGTVVKTLKHTGGLEKDDVIGTAQPMRFEEYMQAIATRCADLGQMLEELTSEQVVHPPVPMDIMEQLKKVESKYLGKGDFELRVDLIEESFEGVADSNDENWSPEINIDPRDFHKLCENIIDNAQRHGFDEYEQECPAIHISVSYPKWIGMVTLAFSNNGRPMPDDFSREKYVLLGETSGKRGNSGIGGNFIQTVMDHVEGYVALNPMDTETFNFLLKSGVRLADIFPVKVELMFPLLE